MGSRKAFPLNGCSVRSLDISRKSGINIGYRRIQQDLWHNIYGNRLVDAVQKLHDDRGVAAISEDLAQGEVLFISILSFLISE
jgi:hypothetical protein